MDTGGQAFPVPFEWGTGHEGMTLRDYFESDIMSGFASRMPYEDIVSIADGTKGGKYYIRAAENLADAMLKQRGKDA